MDGLDIWQSICKFLDTRFILRCRVLSKGHAILGNNLIKQRALMLDHMNIGQLVDWIYNNVRVTKMEAIKLVITDDDDQDSEDEQLEARPEDYKRLPQEECKEDRITEHYSFGEFQNLRPAYKYSLITYSNDLRDEEVVRIIPDELDFDTILYLKYPLMLRNNAGINKDTRGTKFASIEFGDFYEQWHWKQGLLTLRSLAEGCFRLKSHKFENWYEWVHGIEGNIKIVKAVSKSAFLPMTSMYYYSAELSVDHGS
jgi:hypothetical protein